MSCFPPNRRPCYIGNGPCTVSARLRQLCVVKHDRAQPTEAPGHSEIPGKVNIPCLSSHPVCGTCTQSSLASDRINFKVAVLVYGLLNSHQPTYLTDLLSHRPAARTLRSADYQLLDQPRCATAFGGRAFAVTAPRIWNAIPLDIRSAPSVDAFRRQLKTYLFSNRTAV